MKQPRLYPKIFLLPTDDNPDQLTQIACQITNLIADAINNQKNRIDVVFAQCHAEIDYEDPNAEDTEDKVYKATLEKINIIVVAIRQWFFVSNASSCGPIVPPPLFRIHFTTKENGCFGIENPKKYDVFTYKIRITIKPHQAKTK